MNDKTEILRNITTEQLLNELESGKNIECIALEIVKIANSFINTNPIHGLDREDYAQDLFMEVWKRLRLYDDKLGTFSTFCYWWFKSYRSASIRKKKDLLVLDETITDEENITMLDTIQQEEKENEDWYYYLSKLIGDGGIELKMWCNGKTQKEIALELHVTQAQVSRKINAELGCIRKKIGLVTKKQSKERNLCSEKNKRK